MTLLIGHRKRSYTPYPTPLEPLRHLTKWLGGQTRVWIKRDDKTGLALGGNKTRKLEFLLADATDRGCDTLITCGSVQSNHCRLTLSAARREGMNCHLVIREKQAGQYDPDASGNNLLYRLMGATVHVKPPDADLGAEMHLLAASLAADEFDPYVIPMGGSNAIGALGYIACAEELMAQCRERLLHPSAVICASSSGGTQAGLIVGLADQDVPVVGISVDNDATTQCDELQELVRLTSAAIGRDPPAVDLIRVHDDWVGPGYAKPTEEMVEAVRAFARLEGIVLDPVYTGKAAAGLIGLIRRGTFGKSDVVFLHTGGSPALFHYTDPAVPHTPR